MSSSPCAMNATACEAAASTSGLVTFYMDGVALTTVCAVGIVGNLMSAIVLFKISLQVGAINYRIRRCRERTSSFIALAMHSNELLRCMHLLNLSRSEGGLSLHE